MGYSYWALFNKINKWVEDDVLSFPDHSTSVFIKRVLKISYPNKIPSEKVSTEINWIFGEHGLTLLKAKMRR